jgi:hypothetical protein
MKRRQKTELANVYENQMHETAFNRTKSK